MRLRLGIAFAFCVALAAGSAWGQAVVTGVVVNGDPNKPVPNKTVHLVNKTTKPPVDRTAVTGDDGSYLFDNVAPATGYAVDVLDDTGKLQGSDISFTVAPDSQHTAAPDIDIARGVTAAREQKSGGLIQNDRSISPGANISNEQIRVLPLFNRNFLNLGLIQPGVHDVEQGSSLQGAAFSIAGSPSTSTNFLLDGVDNVASSTNQAIPFQVNEAVREFRVTYATPDLRYGQGSGGIVDVITNSGDFGEAGHRWHGSVFGYFNNDSLNGSTPLSVYSNSGFERAAAFSSYSNGLTPTNNVVYITAANSRVQNPQTCNDPGKSGTQPYGVSDLLYCGYSPQTYTDLLTLLRPGSQIGAGVACDTQFCNAGAFNPSAILSTQDSHKQPFTSKQFGGSVGGRIGKNSFLFGSYEATLIDNPTPTFERVPTFLDRTTLPGVSTATGSDQGIAQAMLGLYPAPNVGLTGNTITATNAGVFGFYRGTAPNYTHVNNVQVRPDISLGNLGNLTLRYTGQLLDQLHDDTLPASPGYPGNGANRKAQNQSAAAIYNFQFHESRNLLTIGFTQYRVDEVAQDRNFNASSVGLAQAAMPTVAISGIDPQTTVSAGQATGKKLGYVGGWDDSFWQTNCDPGANLQTCAYSQASQTSPSPITPSLDGDFPLARLGAPLSAPSKHRDTEAYLSDVLDLHLSSRLSLVVGGDYRYQQNVSYEGGLTRGLVVSNNIGEFTHDAETCISCTPTSALVHPSFDYELRQPTGYAGDLRSSSFGAFGETNFRPTPKMTLLTGLRYEYFGQPLDTQNRMWNYDLPSQGLNRQGTFGTFDAFGYQCNLGTQNTGATFFDSLYGDLRSSVPRNVTACSNGNFQLPQVKNDLTGLIGFSYAPDASARHVLRASVGGYFDHAPASYNEKLLENRPNPYNVLNPSAIYGQNFGYSQSCNGGNSCGFGLSSLNFSAFSPTSASAATFINDQASSTGTVMYSRDPRALKTPYLVQFTGGYQYRFSGSWNGEISYVGSLGNQLPLVYDGNFLPEFYCQTNGACTNDTYFPVFTQSNIGNSSYNSIVARVEGRLYKGLSMHASYTYAKSLDNIASSDFPNVTDSIFSQLFGRQFHGVGNPAAFALQSLPNAYGSNGGTRGYEISRGGSVSTSQLLQSANIPTFTSVQSALTTTGSRVVNVSRYSLPQNPLAFSSQGAAQGEDYGRSDFDVRHRGVADFVYNPPLHGKLLGGFAISGITTVQSGQPFTIFSGPAYGQITQRINLSSNSSVKMTGDPARYIQGISSANLPSSPTNGSTCPAIYAQPTLFKQGSNEGACLGNSGRNAFSGPAYFSQDLAAQRSIATREGQNLILRAEFYNVFNRANYYNPISELSADGTHLNPEFGLIRSAHDPRQIQFAVRYDF